MKVLHYLKDFFDTQDILYITLHILYVGIMKLELAPVDVEEHVIMRYPKRSLLVG